MRTPDVQRLRSSMERLDDRIRRWSNARWDGLAADGRPRSQIAHELAVTLSALARQAGNGAPELAPGRVAAHAIADQLVVLGRELTTAPGGASVAGAAEAAVERAVKLF